MTSRSRRAVAGAVVIVTVLFLTGLLHNDIVQQRQYHEEAQIIQQLEAITTPSPITASPITHSPSTASPITSSPTTAVPTTTPTNHSPTTASPTPGYQCDVLGAGKHSTRQPDDYSDWNCTDANQAKLPKRLVVYPASESPIDLTNTTVQYSQVILLDGGDWGKMCNKMSIIIGLLLHLKLPHRQKNPTPVALGDSLIAMNSYFSAVMWTLDVNHLSHMVGGLLLDCMPCGSRKTMKQQLIWDEYRCANLVVKGRVYDVSDITIHRHLSVWIGNLYWGFRFNQLGYDAQVMNALRPQPFLTEIVLDYFDKQRRDGEVSIAMHRRWIEGACYNFAIESASEYMCNNPDAFRLYEPIQHLFTTDAEFKADTARKNFTFMSLDETRRRRYEAFAPDALIPCNFTLDEHQFSIINASWPQPFAGGKFAVLLATDGQTPLGDRAVEQSPFPSRVLRLADMDLPTCFARRRNHDMLAEMLAMSLADYHMELPTSSCSRFVFEWRRALKRPTGSMYPPKCFDGLEAVH